MTIKIGSTLTKESVGFSDTEKEGIINVGSGDQAIFSINGQHYLCNYENGAIVPKILSHNGVERELSETESKNVQNLMNGAKIFFAQNEIIVPKEIIEN